jgi:hypothetical protein
MRRVLIVAISLLWVASSVVAGTFVSIDLACGTTTSVYANFGTSMEMITIQGTDKCAGADSEVQLVGSSGKVMKHFVIKDKSSKAFRIFVPSGESLNFVCNGDNGGCTYSLSVP